MYVEDILDRGEYACEADVGHLKFEKIVFRPNEITNSCIYFHLKGKACELDELRKIIKEHSPVCIVTGENVFRELCDIPIITVKNPRRSLAISYSRFCGIDMNRLKFIGITGTNGKTTSASMIKEILIAEGKTVGFIGTGKIESDGKLLTNFGYSMTTPDPDLLYPAIKRMEADGCEYIVMEASSHALALEKLAPIIFEVGVFTNLSHEHIDFHGTMNEYFKTKMKLFRQCKLGIFNVDDEYGRRAFAECEINKKSVGILWSADVMAKEPALNGFNGSTYLYKGEDFIFKMNLPLVGAYNIYNSLSAVCAAHAVGCRPCTAKRALEAMRSPDGRFEVWNSSVTVIIDYAHTPSALENVLKTIKSCKNSEQKLISVFGCGGLRDKEKRPLMGRISEELADFTVLTEDNSRCERKEDIISDIIAGFRDKSRAAIILSRKEAIENAILDAEDGSVIAILGKGAERYNIDKDGTHPFDERKIVENALEKRKRLGADKDEG